MSWKARAGVFGLFLMFGLWLAYEMAPRTTVEEEQSTEEDRLAVEQALALIANESRSIDGAEQPSHRAPTQLAKAPPGFESAPLTDRPGTPPEGYGFVTHHDVTGGGRWAGLDVRLGQTGRHKRSRGPPGGVDRAGRCCPRAVRQSPPGAAPRRRIASAGTC